MSAPVIPLNSEIDSINDMKSVAETSFQQCKDMIQDIFTHNSDVTEDIQILKVHMNDIAEYQKKMSGLIYATNEISDLTDKVNLTESEATYKFIEKFDEYIEDNDIDDDQNNVLFSLDHFTNDEQVSDHQGEDTDLLVTKTALSYKDPLTQCIMQDPVKSKFCKHSYEKDSIIAYLADKTRRCPVSGCQSNLSKKDLVDDFVLKLKLSLQEKPS